QKASLGRILALLVFVSATGTQAQMTRRQRYEKDVEQLKIKLEEYHQGKRDDNDGGAILSNLLHDYAVLGSSTTADASAVKAEWQNLLSKHPEFKSKHPRLHEEVTAIEARKAAGKELEAKGKNFSPKDSRYFEIVGHDDEMALVYQYHVEFFKLPSSMKVERDQRAHFHINVNGQAVRGGKGIRALGLKPIKTIWFAHRINAPHDIYESSDSKFLFVCDDLMGAYSGSDAQESKVLWAKSPDTNGTIKWTIASADYPEFCGAFSLGGEILFQLPIKQHLPDTVIQVWHTSRDGLSAELRVGEVIEMSVDAQHVVDSSIGEKITDFGNVRKVLIYTFPNSLETYDAVDDAGIKAARSAHGL